MNIFMFIFLLPAFAGGKDCNQIKDHRTFYLCSIEKHPLSKVADMKANEGAALYEQASQWKNPELSLKSVAGSVAGEMTGTTEVNASVSLSQLWQRGRRLEVAENERKISNVSARDSFLNVKKEVIRSTFRWRQIEDEQGLIGETLKTFSTIQSQLRGRRIRVSLRQDCVTG